MPEDLIFVGMRAGVEGQFSGGLVHIEAPFFTLINGVNLHLHKHRLKKILVKLILNC